VTVISLSGGGSITVTQIETQAPGPTGSTTASPSSSTSTGPLSGVATQGKSKIGLAAGPGAGLGLLFALFVALGAFLWWRRKNKPDASARAPAEPEIKAAYKIHEGKSELHSDSRVMSMATTDIGSGNDYAAPVGATQDQKPFPREAEMEGNFHATASPMEFAAPDMNIAGYGNEGRYELPAHRS
jgi:hypothetical protein